jgi:signal transduction histidine kinase/YHS domain-containing protein
MSLVGKRFGVTVAALAALWCVAVVSSWWLPFAALWLALAIAGLAIALLVLADRAAVQPLVELAQRASRIAVGEWDALATPCQGVPEVEALRRAINAMAEHVRRAQTTGQQYAAAISEGQEAERTRVAHDLHDATVQSLIAIAQRLERAGRLIETDPQRARAVVAEARQDTVATIAGLREIIADLRPPALDELGLVPALELMIRRLPPTPAVRLEIEGPVRRLAPERELAVLRMAQEGISNVRRHAHASSAIVRLRFEPEALTVAIEDDGQGIGRQPAPGELAQEGHWGLIGLEERAARFGGSVRLASANGKGTRLTIRLPNAEGAQPESAVVDPVCKATVAPATAYGSVMHDGETYFFCCPVCQGAFQREPARYAHGGSQPAALAS